MSKKKFKKFMIELKEFLEKNQMELQECKLFADDGEFILIDWSDIDELP